MSHMLYRVSSKEIIFNGEHDFENMRNVYQWSAIEIEDDDIIGCDVKIFDPLDIWNDLEVEDPEMKLMYRVFNGN